MAPPSARIRLACLILLPGLLVASPARPADDGLLAAQQPVPGTVEAEITAALPP